MLDAHLLPEQMLAGSQPLQRGAVLHQLRIVGDWDHSRVLSLLVVDPFAIWDAGIAFLDDLRLGAG